ncbi:T9SS C-terminal target domain-containing protein [candidate division KSB1 bacterium]|nr:lamin tail domain-containing protein [candidate division KSB1 bacterium]RQW05534.1 MAG: T9SS C-terminal target domain-containing protein [candidate division KSB1 bacterium]
MHHSLKYIFIICGMGFTLLICPAPFALTQTVRINEFMAINSTTLADKDGVYSDWIELYNPTATAVNLAGYSLTDDVASPRKWLFPEKSLASHSYLVIFASGKDVADATGECHTNFRLDGDGEYLALFDAAGTVLSEFAPAFPEQFADVSYCYVDGDYIASTRPTPGAVNRFESHNMLPPPHFSHQRGFYESPFQVQLISELANAEIYYTRDGSEPRRSSANRYTEPIFITTTTVLRAIVCLSGDLTSAPMTHTYLFLDDVLAQPNDPPGYPDEWGPYTAIAGTAIADYEMDPDITENPLYAPFMKEALLSIPTLSLVTKKENLFSHSTDADEGGIYIYTGPPEAGDVPGLGDDWERPASAEFFTADGSEEFQVNCGLRLQGGHSRRPEKSPKHSFRLVFKSEYGPTRLNYPLFENAVQSFNTITLRAGFGNEWIHWSHGERRRGNFGRDMWAKDTQHAMGQPAGHGRYVHLYVNGLYWGLYNPTERLDREFAESYLGGDALDYDVIKDYTSVVDGTIAAWNDMMTLARRDLSTAENYQRIQGNNPDGSANSNYEAYVDIVNLVDYMILNFYGGNTDWDHHNWVAIRNRVQPGNGFQFFSWDAEHILKEVNENVINENNDNCPSGLFQRLIRNADFRRLFADRLQLHCYNGGALTPEASAARWRNRAQQIDLAIIAESARWGDYRRDVHRYQEQGPFDLYDKQYWQDEQDYLLNDYFPSRTNTLIAQLRAVELFPDIAAPQFMVNNQPVDSRIIKSGDELSMSVAAGSIYYTLDGSDPLLSQPSDPGNETVLVPEHAQKRVLVPKANIGTDWRTAADYDDASWRLCRGAPGGVGYEKGSGYEGFISLDVSEDMHDDGANPNPSCYLRIKFRLSQSERGDIKSLLLNVRYDDGFVAFLNGTQIAESNVPASVQWNSNAPANHEAAGLESFNVSQFITALVEGDNLLAIQGLNTNTSSSDFLINAELVASDQSGASGNISPHAMLYTQPIELHHSTHIKARTLLGDEYSALNEIMLVLPSDLYNLRFTEIHYHPSVLDTVDNRSFEFLELKNIGASPIDVSGVQFSRGLTYTFPMNTILNPGSFIVLASNPQQFVRRYGFAPFGDYDGFLANDGETLALVNVANDTLLSVRYDDRAPWPEQADGGGFSLVPKDVNPPADQNDPQQWRISLDIHGSPGRDDKPDTSIQEAAGITVDQFRLQNYPNPFNPGTTILYDLPKRVHVTLTVYDILGREIIKLIDGIQEPNRYTIWLDATQLVSGVYFYRLRAGDDYLETQKMLLVR